MNTGCIIIRRTRKVYVDGNMLRSKIRYGWLGKFDDDYQIPIQTLETSHLS